MGDPDTGAIRIAGGVITPMGHLGGVGFCVLIPFSPKEFLGPPPGRQGRMPGVSPSVLGCGPGLGITIALRPLGRQGGTPLGPGGFQGSEACMGCVVKTQRQARCFMRWVFKPRGWFTGLVVLRQVMLLPSSDRRFGSYLRNQIDCGSAALLIPHGIFFCRTSSSAQCSPRGLAAPWRCPPPPSPCATQAAFNTAGNLGSHNSP